MEKDAHKSIIETINELSLFEIMKKGQNETVESLLIETQCCRSDIGCELFIFILIGCNGQKA